MPGHPRIFLRFPAPSEVGRVRPDYLRTAALAGCYTVERELGRGSMATVYLARDLRPDRLVALKILRLELAAALVRRMLQEAIDIATRQGPTAFVRRAAHSPQRLCV